MIHCIIGKEASMQSKQFCIYTTSESRRTFSASKMHLSPPMANAADRSKAVVLLMLIYCLLYFQLFFKVLCCLCFVMHYFEFIIVLQSS